MVAFCNSATCRLIDEKDGPTPPEQSRALGIHARTLEVFEAMDVLGPALERGRRIRAVLSQPQYAPLRLVDEVALVLAVQDGLLDHLPLDLVGRFRAEIPAWLDTSASAIVNEIMRTGRLGGGKRVELKAALGALIDRLMPATAAR